MSEQPVFEVVEQPTILDLSPPPRPELVITDDSLQGEPGEQGDPGPPGGAIYEMELVIPTTSVTINHGFGYRPSVRFTTTDGFDSQVTSEHPDDDTTVVSSVLPMLGHLTLS
jgi:hypothetical protein